jgi:hypothetical protein
MIKEANQISPIYLNCESNIRYYLKICSIVKLHCVILR